MNNSVKLEPGTTEWNLTYYKDDNYYTHRRIFGKRLLQRPDRYVFGSMFAAACTLSTKCLYFIIIVAFYIS